MKIYTLRYTNDLYVIRKSDNLSDLTKDQWEYKVHVIDDKGNVVWQNSESQRYGRTGLDMGQSK